MVFRLWIILRVVMRVFGGFFICFCLPSVIFGFFSVSIGVINFLVCIVFRVLKG